MMAQKARLFGDDAIQAHILAATSPRAVKTLGRRIRNFDEAAGRRRARISFMTATSANSARILH